MYRLFIKDNNQYIIGMIMYPIKYLEERPGLPRGPLAVLEALDTDSLRICLQARGDNGLARLPHHAGLQCSGRGTHGAVL